MDKILTINIKIKSERPEHVRFLNANLSAFKRLLHELV